MLILAIIIFVIGANYKNQPSSGKKTALLVLGIITLIMSIIDLFSLGVLIAFRAASEMDFLVWFEDIIREAIKEMNIADNVIGSAINAVFIVSIVVMAIETILGLFSSIFALVRQSNKKLAAQISAAPVSNANNYAGGVKTCANCGQICQPGFYVCPRCGSSIFNQQGVPTRQNAYTTAPQQPIQQQPIQQQPVQQQPVQQEQPEDAPVYEWFCTSCGKSNPAASKFCSSCGSKNPNNE